MTGPRMGRRQGRSVPRGGGHGEGRSSLPCGTVRQPRTAATGTPVTSARPVSTNKWHADTPTPPARSRSCRRPSGTLPGAPWPHLIPCSFRGNSGAETLRNSGRQIAPENRRERRRNGPGSRAGEGAPPAAGSRSSAPRASQPGKGAGASGAAPGVRLGAPGLQGVTPAAQRELENVFGRLLGSGQTSPPRNFQAGAGHFWTPERTWDSPEKPADQALGPGLADLFPCFLVDFVSSLGTRLGEDVKLKL